MVLTNDFVTHELEHARESVADDRGAYVAHVHLLRDVRRGVVDNDAIDPCGPRHAKPFVGRARRDALLEYCGLQREVDEARARDLDAVAQRTEIGRGDDRCRDLAR